MILAIVASVWIALVLGFAGERLARREQQVIKPVARELLEDRRQVIGAKLRELERYYADALDDVADATFEHGVNWSVSRASRVVGVGTISRFFAPEKDKEKDKVKVEHSPLAGNGVALPAAGDDAKEGEARFASAELFKGASSAWVERPGRGLYYLRRQESGKDTVVIGIRRSEVAVVVERELRGLTEAPAGAAALTILPPGAATENDMPPDEVMLLSSIFGDWRMEMRHARELKVAHHVPTLTISGLLALTVLVAGAGLAVTQARTLRLAQQRVSFVNRVSHELRTPLTNLLLNTDLALDDLSVEDGKLRRRLGLIREETSRLSRIVDNVLAFARIERGKHENRAAACDLTELVGELRDGFAPLFERKSIVCDYEVGAVDGLALDRDALAQILANLLSNVEKYAGEGARAAVRATVNDGELSIEVEDNGPGIPREARQRVFLPFERAGSRVDEGASGTGLGLAISRELAQRMGGRLELVAADSGAKFRLVIPVGERAFA